jgi:hypothetical protein
MAAYTSVSRACRPPVAVRPRRTGFGGACIVVDGRVPATFPSSPGRPAGQAAPARPLRASRHRPAHLDGIDGPIKPGHDRLSDTDQTEAIEPA